MKNLLKTILLLVFFILCSSPETFSFVKKTGVGVGSFNDIDSATPLIVIDNDLISGDLIFGTSIIAKGDKQLYGYGSFVLRYLEYDNGVRGLFYEELDNTTFGYGLLLSDLNTIYPHPVYASRLKNCIRSYIFTGYYTVDIISTYNNLFGLNVRDLRLYGLDVGLEYVNKADGLADHPNSYLPYSSAYGVNVAYPISEGLKLYSEAAKTSADSSGVSFGLSCDYELFFLFANCRIEGRSFDPDFVPGYFTSGYFLNPVNAASYEAAGSRRDGTLASVHAAALGFVGFGLTYENYTDSYSALSMDFIVTPLKGMDVTGYFKQPTFRQFRDISGDDAVMVGGALKYRIKDILLSADYKKAPLPGATTAYETTYISAQCEF